MKLTLKIILCAALAGWAPSARAALDKQRSFYLRYAPFFAPSFTALPASSISKISLLAEGDLRGYFHILFEAWRASLPGRDGAQLGEIHGRVQAVDARLHPPEFTGDAITDSWGLVHILLPAPMHQASAYYYFLETHELEHGRQQFALFEATDAYPDQLFTQAEFWVRFERERAAMTMEWVFLHYAPAWVREAFAREIASIVPPNRFTAMARLCLDYADASLHQYLEAQWAAGRYSWELLHEKCAASLLPDAPA